MIQHYAICLPGPSHVELGLPCQDACQVRLRADGVAIAAVADGLGSERFSHIGARVAAESCVRYCAGEYRAEASPEEKLALLKRSFWIAYAATLLEADSRGEPAEQFDATLCLAVWDGDELFYGQAGDSGLIVLLRRGNYLALTEQQRDEANRVFPLCSGETCWRFGHLREPVSAAMLMTDGVWDQLVPPILRREDVRVNVALAERFMNRAEESEAELAEVEETARAFLRELPREQLDDDKTALVLFDPSKPAKRLEDAYYMTPDWNAIWEKLRSQLYDDDIG